MGLWVGRNGSSVGGDPRDWGPKSTPIFLGCPWEETGLHSIPQDPRGLAGTKTSIPLPLDFAKVSGMGQELPPRECSLPFLLSLFILKVNNNNKMIT